MSRSFKKNAPRVSIFVTGVLVVAATSFLTQELTRGWSPNSVHRANRHPQSGGGEAKISERTLQRGEMLLQACVKALDDKVSPAEEKIIFQEWDKLNAALNTPRLGAQLIASEKVIGGLSLPGAQRGSLVIAFFRLLPVLPRDESVRDPLISARSLMTQVFTKRPFADRATIGRTTVRLNEAIMKSAQLNAEQKVLAQARLIAFESAMVTEMDRVFNHVNSQNGVTRAVLRPVLYGIGGAAAFVGAVVVSEPLLGGSVIVARAAGSAISSGPVMAELSAGIGKIAATSMVAGLGAAGVDTIIDLALERWIAAGTEARARDIPMGCALAKHIEIGKEQELKILLQAAKNGAITGLVVSGLTFGIPTLLGHFGGVAIRSAEVKSLPRLAATGSRMVKVASNLDEVALTGVVLLVGIGGVFEGYEMIESILEGMDYNHLLAEIDHDIQEAHAKKNPELVERLKELRRQAASLQYATYGKAVTNGVSVLVCGYLLYHMAHGEFMEAWRGELSEVMDALAMASDDAPTGIKAATGAAKKAMLGGTSASPTSVKLGLLKAKLIATKGGSLTVAVKQAIDELLAMSNSEMEDDIEKIEAELKKMMQQ